MTCGCNKNKGTKCIGPNCTMNPNKTTPSVPSIEKPEMQFTERSVSPQSSISKKVGMVQSFASAIASRGATNNKVNIPLKQLRVLSCFGNKDQNGELPPCEYLRKSKTEGKFFCGGCGCGDKPLTWLLATGDIYSKLDYPKLNCPLQMPGFSNYKESGPEEAISPITRRYYVENINYDAIKTIAVSVHEVAPTPPIPENP